MSGTLTLLSGRANRGKTDWIFARLNALQEAGKRAVLIVPEQYMGDVMGDLNSKRGRILGMNAAGRKQVIEALVPLAEMFEYSKQLRSISQGRGTFEMVYDHFERVPGEEQAKIVAAAQPEAEEEE